MKIAEIVAPTLTERVMNLHTPTAKEKFVDAVWNIMQRSYEKLGGFKSVSSPEEMINNSGLWKLVRRDGEITSANLYKDQFGRKSFASGTNGTEQGKRDYLMIKNDDLRLHRAWAEVSGPVEKILKRSGAFPIPSKFAASLTDKEILEYNDDGYHYTRLIAGHPHEKIIYGSIQLSPDDCDFLSKNDIELHALPAGFFKKIN